MQAPLIPGTSVRFVEPDHQFAQRFVRDRVQDGGAHIYVYALPFVLGGARPLCLVEAYEPVLVRPGYLNQLDPMRVADMRDGNRIAIHTLSLRGTFRVGGTRPGAVDAFWPRDLDERMTDEIRRNNRNARADLKRTSSGYDRSLELQNADEAEFAAVAKPFGDAFEDAWSDTMDFAMGTPRSSGYNPRGKS